MLASLPFNVTANEGSFVRWQITGNSFVLLPIEPTGDVTIDNIIKILINTPVGQRREVVEHLLPIIQRPSNEIHRITTPLITPIGSFRRSECWRF